MLIFGDVLMEEIRRAPVEVGSLFGLFKEVLAPFDSTSANTRVETWTATVSLFSYIPTATN